MKTHFPDLRKVALVAVLCALASTSHAAEPAPKPEPLLQADNLRYDEDKEIITALGNVELAYGDQVLRADKMTYNKKDDVVWATGHVAIISQKTGEILYTKQLKVTSDLREGFIDRIGVMFPDKSRLVAVGAQRYEGRYLIAEKGIYSACSLCADDPRKPPLWQLKAVRVTHDNEKKDVMYRDATVEFWGVPVFYTPYFSHPDPTVTRRQGLLFPSAGGDGNLGFMARTPYYFDLAPNSDLLVTPTFSQNDKLQLAADWRHRFTKGSMRWSGSFTHADFVNESGEDLGKRWRGHIFGDTLFNLDDKWRTGSNIAYASDKSYLPRYKITSEDLLVSRAYAERFKGRNYFVGNTYYFEDLRPGKRLVEPIVAPELRYSAFGEPGKTLGGRWSLNSSLLVTSRTRDADLTKQGPNTRRLAMDAGWQRQLVSNTGFLTTVSGLARLDNYWADNVPDPNVPLGSGFSNMSKVRPFAQADISVRYPLGRRGSGYRQILEPIAVLSVAPRASNNDVLPNEDSLDVEFDETSLFAQNRFSGIDRIEGGIRTAYGVRHAIFGDGGERIEMLVGQVFRLKRDMAFTEGSGLRDRLSDYVGRIDLSPAAWFDANYGFRLNQKDFSPTRQQLQASAGVPIFRPYVNYLSLKQSEESVTFDERVEEVGGGITSKFAQYWGLTLAHTQAINPAPGPRATSAKIEYQDECFKSALTVERTYTNRADLSSGLRVLFNFYLKNLGGVDSNN